MLKFKFIAYFTICISLILISLSIAGCVSGRFQYVGRAIYHGMGKIDHYKSFHNRVVFAGSHQKWPLSEQYGKTKLPDNLKKRIENTNPLAFLVIKDGEILFERYWKGYTENTISNSFSMAKSITSALVGIAIDEGRIKNIDQYVSDFLPQFKENNKEKIQIKHLLTMTSGLAWNESTINPFSISSKAYYGGNVAEVVLNLESQQSPGTVFYYKGCDTQLLTLILQNVTGKKISEYASEKLWQPIGAKHPALWSLDTEGGDEFGYCCFNATTRDFARFGQLFLNEGRWKDKQLISGKYIKQSTTPALFSDGTQNDEYGYMWWLTTYRNLNIYYAWGFKEQYIAVIPEKNIVFVRLADNIKIFNQIESVHLHVDSALVLADES